jgi:hypothetical protein
MICSRSLATEADFYFSPSRKDRIDMGMSPPYLFYLLPKMRDSRPGFW